MPHTFTNLLVHVIFSTKDRLPVLTDETRPEIHAYLGGIVRELGGMALCVNGTADHVHMLIRQSATVSIADYLRVTKTNSSRWAREHFGRRFAWQTGYGAFSVSASSQRAVERYIQSQEQHHRKMTFQEEFITFLRKQGLAYDERFIWE